MFEVIVKLVEHLAWPLTTLGIILLFRKPISDLIKRIKKISSGDKSIELDLVKIAAQQQPDNKNIDLNSVTKETCNYETYLDLMESFTHSQLGTLAFIVQDEGSNDLLQPLIKRFESALKKLEEERPNAKSIIKLRETYRKLYKIIEKVL